jgi:hypothetical protein
MKVEQNGLELLINYNDNNVTDFYLHILVGCWNKKDYGRQGITYYSYNAKDNESERWTPIAETNGTQSLDKDDTQTIIFGIDCWGRDTL